MDFTKSFILICMLLLICSCVVDGGPVSWASCMAAVGVGGAFVGSAILPLLGFTSSGIAAGSWAASIVSASGGAVPSGSLFAMLKTAGASSIALSSYNGVSEFCTALTEPFD